MLRRHRTSHFSVHNYNLPICTTNFSSDGIRFGSDTKTGEWDIQAYFPFASLTKESKMTPYHKKLNLLTE